MKEIEFDVLDADAEKSVRTSATKLLKALTTRNNSREMLRKQIWPAAADVRRQRVTLRLVPLSRLGGNEGKSKASVFVAYFRRPEGGWPSHPLIVKFAELDGARDPCSSEFDDYKSVSNYVDLSPCGFAAPLVCHKSDAEQPLTVLWSPFASAGAVWGKDAYEQRLNLEMMDVWHWLTESTDKPRDVSGDFGKVFDYLWPLHHRGGTAQSCKKNLFDEYRRYLRKIHDRGWSKKWMLCWGDESVKTTHMFGSDWPNPFYVLDRLKGVLIDMYCGCVHGDLHPKNIVIAHDVPKVIDFGWASKDAHIAKDFVLMECNLRFVTLSSAMPYQDVLRLSQCLSFTDPIPVFSEPMQQRFKLIALIRDRARKAFPTETAWDEEYLVPMFVVAMGLLKHSNDFLSHVSTQLHVLQLAKYVLEKVLTKHE